MESQRVKLRLAVYLTISTCYKLVIYLLICHSRNFLSGISRKTDPRQKISGMTKVNERSILQTNGKANSFVLRKIDFSRSLIYSCRNYMQLTKARFEMTVKTILFLCASVPLWQNCSLLTYRTSEVKQNEFQYANISKAHFTPNNEKPFPLTVRRGNNIYNSVTPDGKYLFFASDSSGNFDIYLRDLQIDIKVTGRVTCEE